MLQKSVETRSHSRACVKRVFEETYVLKGQEHTQKVLELNLVHGCLPTTQCTSILNQSMYMQEQLQHDPPVQCYVRLRDEWMSLTINPDDMLHLIGHWEMIDGAPVMTLATFVPDTAKESQHLLILHPDTIISASRLASVASCMRKSMLQERIRSPVESTYVAVLGTCVHAVFQACLTASIGEGEGEPCADVQAPLAWDRLGNFSRAFLTAEIERQLSDAQEALIRVNVSTNDARADLCAAVPSIVAFGERFLAYRDGRPSSMAVVQDSRTSTFFEIRITRVVGTECDILCPMYGLKGRMDVCVEAEVQSGEGVQRALFPIEVKTGRVTSSMEHVAQTSLYTLLLADAFGVQVDYGFLLYMQGCEMRRVHRVVKEVRSLIMARNEMASYKVQMPLLPDRSLRAIDVAEVESTLSSPASHDSFDEFDDADLENALMDVTPRFLPPTIDSRFKCERCYSRDACMLYRRAVEHVTDTDSPIAKLYAENTQHLSAQDMAFFAAWDALLSHEERSLQRHQFELWTMSADARQSTGRCVTDAKLTQVTADVCEFAAPRATFAPDDMIVIAVQRPVTAFLVRACVLSSQPHLRVRPESSMNLALAQYCAQYGEAKTFRLDLDDLMSMMGVPRYNLVCMFYKNATPQIEALRRRVVHLDALTWGNMDEHMRKCVAKHTYECNADQRYAIERALCAHDYTLILGMPGTGKSTTIAVLVRICVELGQRVLLCSHTHSAVDTIVRKMLDMPVLRLGALSRIHPQVHGCALAMRLGPDASAEKVLHVVETSPVVAATCLAMNDASLARQAFDLCIVDEASQISVPTCLGPLRLAHRFVMIGDHHQLTPLVRNAQAAQHGMDVSLFQRLCKAHPQAVAPLCTQYRMNEGIMGLSNELVYDGRLACGSDAIATAALSLEDVPAWLAPVLDATKPAVFVDTDGIDAFESRADTMIENESEAAWIVHTVEALMQAGIASADLGVLTPYRQQAKALREQCACEVLTIDQAQGRDWRIVLVSLVRSNAAHNVGELLCDARRVNVMITRARVKLVLVGSRQTMSSGPPATPMPALLGVLERRDAIVALEGSALCPSPRRQRYVKRARVAQPVLTDILNDHDMVDED